VVVLPPSVDRARFLPPPDASPDDGPVRLGFVGRLERSKGVLEVPPLLARLAGEGVDARAELIGPADLDQRAELDEAAAPASPETQSAEDFFAGVQEYLAGDRNEESIAKWFKRPGGR
ncbi:MAG: hypothetical protein KY393_04605, partial [Actinobacteria bacterium]|nr:hypothetical protein [Actinomycetota bacterium]